jgi:hypothetical protein
MTYPVAYGDRGTGGSKRKQTGLVPYSSATLLGESDRGRGWHPDIDLTHNVRAQGQPGLAEADEPRKKAESA